MHGAVPAAVERAALRPGNLPRPRTKPRRTLGVRSIDARFHRSLHDGEFQGRVHSVFERVINIERDNGELHTLASRDIDDAPNTAILDTAGFGGTAVLPGDRVRQANGKLFVGGYLAIAHADALPWQGALPAWPVTTHALRSNLELARNARGPGVRRFTQVGATTAFDGAVIDLLEHCAGQLWAALSAQRPDFADACGVARQMLGLGRGLTPSGDDFLVGLFAVLNLRGNPCFGWLDGGRQVLIGAQTATNAISLAALLQAAEGRVRQSISALIADLLHGTGGPALCESLDRVLAIGSSSGADMVAGIRFGLELNLSHERKLPCQSKS